jgi:hypothetical protein
VSLVEIECLGEGSLTSFPDQRQEPDHIAINHPRREQDFVAITDEQILTQCLAQTEKRLAQILPGLGVEMRAPEQRCQLLTWLRCGSSADEVRQQAGQLLVG